MKKKKDVNLKKQPTYKDDLTKFVQPKEKKQYNKDIMRITYLFSGLFAILIGYFVYFQVVQGAQVINNSYNKRQELLAETVTRGMLLANNGEILAESIEDKNGTVIRNYPYKNMFAHVVGRYLKGKTGLESSQGFLLLTSTINPVESIWKDIAGEKKPGDNVITTLDVGIQKVASDALGKQEGAVVVMEPSTGKILAMVSKPDYNPNNIETLWEKLSTSDGEDSVLFNTATQGKLIPGSTFKIVTALAYMRQNPDYEQFEITCNGEEEINGKVVRCYKGKAHGTVNLTTAMASSCNIAFAKLGMDLDLTQYKKTVDSLLFNNVYKFDFAVRQSNFNLSPTETSPDLIIDTAYGQGSTDITPMQNALLVSAIANNGILMKPYLVDRIENYEGELVKQYLPTTYATLMSTTEASILNTMLEEVVQSGTATKLKGQNYTAAGKTGTAEVAGQSKDDAWFVGYASTEQPDIVVSIIVKNVGTGSDYAVPIAKKIFAEYYK